MRSMAATDPTLVFASHRWADWRAPDFARLDPARTVAVLPLGATEQHGPHLPLSVDTDLVEGVVDVALTHLTSADPVLVLPTLPVGVSTEHTAFAGTLSVSPQTALQLWGDVAASVARAGVKKLLLFNAHGGHAGLMEVAAREWRGLHGLTVFSSSWYQLPLGHAMDAFSAHEQRFGVHAGEVETSMMLALSPERVDMTQAQAFASASEQRAAHFSLLGDGRSAKLGWHMQDYNPHGATGDAAAATAERGHALLQETGAQLAKLLRELVQFAPLT